jgi:hypothetical protein
MNRLAFAFAALAIITTPVLAAEMATTTPPLALAEPEAPAVTVLPHSSVTEAEPLALPEPETEAVAPFKRCSDRETVYLTN